MKKRNFETLKLNKKSISNFKAVEVTGGGSGAETCGGQTSSYPTSFRECKFN
ncbi:MAG: hypothetical protein AAF611_12980 [Bacteroidota bacterium]